MKVIMDGEFVEFEKEKIICFLGDKEKEITCIKTLQKNISVYISPDMLDDKDRLWVIVGSMKDEKVNDDPQSRGKDPNWAQSLRSHKPVHDVCIDGNIMYLVSLMKGEFIRVDDNGHILLVENIWESKIIKV